MDVQAFLDQLRGDPAYQGQIVAHHRLPAAEPRTAELDPPLPDALRQALSGLGVPALYAHQVEAVQHARAGRDLVVVTGTASGKTLCYNLPVIERLLTRPGSRALYLFPLKALAHDQLRQLESFGLWRQIRAAAYDGDTPEDERRVVRASANLVLTNPDMLHLGILPRHTLWADFLARLEFVVVDEVHMYRGVFGSHAAHVFRRLLRLCERYGSRPTFIGCSATIANPAELAEQLTGRPFAVVDRSGAPTGAKHVVVWNPPVQEPATGLRRSANLEATFLLAELARRGRPTLAFTVARQEAELVLRYLRAALEADGRELIGRVAAYRAGYLATERRDIEQRLAAGSLLAVVSTVALEAGIDIGALDAVLMVGYPGTVAGFRQQAGRAGRGRRDSLALLIARAGPVDQFYARHPEALWSAPVERALIDPDNVYIAGSHLLCAAYEHPLGGEELASLGRDAAALCALFESERFLAHRDGRWYYALEDYPAAQVSLRAAGTESYELFESHRGEVLGVEDTSRLWEECFPGAIHLHDGEQYLVERVETESRRVVLQAVSVNYYTRPMVDIDIGLDAVTEQRDLGAVTVGFGDLTVTKTTIGYRRLAVGSQELIAIEDVATPPQTIETTGLWLTLHPDLRRLILESGGETVAGLHAVEHALAAALPMVAMCDPRDVQGSSVGLHPQLAEPALFLFDQHPGGVGLVERGFEAIADLLARAHEMIAGCTCSAGCPACIHSPFCGTGNQLLDKALAQTILRAALSLEGPLGPKEE